MPYKVLASYCAYEVSGHGVADAALSTVRGHTESQCLYNKAFGQKNNVRWIVSQMDHESALFFSPKHTVQSSKLGFFVNICALTNVTQFLDKTAIFECAFPFKEVKHWRWDKMLIT